MLMDHSPELRIPPSLSILRAPFLQSQRRNTLLLHETQPEALLGAQQRIGIRHEVPEVLAQVLCLEDEGRGRLGEVSMD